MKCAVCKHGSFIQGITILTLENKGAVFVVRQVPARVCDNCGEAFVSEEISKRVFKLIQGEAKAGVQVEILNYAA